MRYYPVNLDILEKKCLVVGGGQVAQRKVGTLLECGAKVYVAAKQACQKLWELSKNKQISLKIKEYDPRDLEGMFLVIGATNDKNINVQIHEDAKKQKVICNIADYPKACDFILPSIVNRGDLIIAISTSGKSPALAKKLRKELGAMFGDEYAKLLQIMGSARKKLLAKAHAPEEHKPLFEKLLDSGLLEMVKEDDVKGVNELLFEVLGEKFDYT